jgi:hypothetical protein
MGALAEAGLAALRAALAAPVLVGVRCARRAARRRAAVGERGRHPPHAWPPSPAQPRPTPARRPASCNARRRGPPWATAAPAGSPASPPPPCAPIAPAPARKATLVWLVSIGTRRWTDDAAWAKFPPDFGCDDGAVWDGCTARQAAWLLLPPAAAGAAAVLYVYARAAAAAAAAAGGAPARRAPRLGWLGRAASAQLPPARLWAWWCGGLSGADAALVGGWLLVNGLWLGAILKRWAPPGESQAPRPPAPCARPSALCAAQPALAAHPCAKPATLSHAPSPPFHRPPPLPPTPATTPSPTCWRGSATTPSGQSRRSSPPSASGCAGGGGRGGWWGSGLASSGHPGSALGCFL